LAVGTITVMSHEGRLLDIIVEWEERRAAGREASPEDLCRGCPELIEPLKESLRALNGMNALLDAEGPPPDGPAGRTEVLTQPPAICGPVPRDAWPVIPQYEILEELGRGGMGIVLKARQIALGRIVAVKAILPHGPIREQQRRRFLREAKAMALLQHPNIVQIHEISQQGEQPYLIMEYVEGQSLSANLAEKPLPPRKAAELLTVLARAVHAAHEHGIVHRDLKPNNILLAADGTPKICDFGLALHFENAVDHTQTNQILGTPSYMAPEQVLGASEKQGPAVDVYALGAVLYESLTGRPAFLADNPLDTMQLVLKQQPVPPRQWQPKTPRDLETICLKCLAKEPRRRYASALELAEDLQRYLAGDPIRARPVGRVERSWRWCRAHPSGAALISVASLAAIVVLTVVMVYNGRLSRELQRIEVADRQVLTTQEKLHRTLTQVVGDRLDGDLRELAVVPLTTATLLENRRDWDEEHIQRALKDMLHKTPLIFGLCVAFEPYAWRKDRQDFALYVYRRREGLAVKQLLPPAYQPLYRQWQWYLAAKDSPQGRWSEPYVGEGGDRTPMVTFSAPIRRDGRFAGVVAADLAMDYFRDLRNSIDRMDLGPKSHCFLVSSGRRILAHPLDRYEFPGPDADLARIPLDASFRDLVGQWTRATAGIARAVDFSTGRPASFLFYRIPSSGWTLVTVIY
jgi:serine/threonine protein kinase